MIKWFRKIKPGVRPRPPRSKNPSNSENIPPRQETSSSTHEPEEDFVEPDNKSKSNKSGQYESSVYHVNTQADGGTVMNFFNGVDIHVGPKTKTYINIGSTGDITKQPKSEDRPPGDPEINLLLEAEIKPERKHLVCVSQHLGKNWYDIFMKLGFTKGEIGTKENSELSAKYGVKDVCYKLLLKWVEKDEENTLGRLAKFLWDVNERGVVKELAKVYNGGH